LLKYEPDHLLLDIHREEALTRTGGLGRIEEMLQPDQRGRTITASLDRVSRCQRHCFWKWDGVRSKGKLKNAF